MSYRQVTTSTTTTLTVEKVSVPEVGSINEPEDKIIEDNDSGKTTYSGWLWKVPSGIYQIGAGAVGLGVGTVKWAATSTCSVGTGIVSSGLEIASKVSLKKPPKSKSD